MTKQMKKRKYSIKVTYVTKKGTRVTARRKTTSRPKWVQYQLKKGLVPLKTSSMKQIRWVKKETFNRKIAEEKLKIKRITEEKQKEMKKYFRIIAGKTWYSRNMRNTPFPVVATYLYTVVEAEKKSDAQMEVSYVRLDALEKRYVFTEHAQMELINKLHDVREITPVSGLEHLEGSEEREIDEDEFQATGLDLGNVYFSWAWFKDGKVVRGYPKPPKVISHV